jgi:hypothetical protein
MYLDITIGYYKKEPLLRSDSLALFLREIFSGKNPRIIFLFGSDLLSQDLAIQVSSAQEGLTSVFGMGTGVAPPV